MTTIQFAEGLLSQDPQHEMHDDRRIESGGRNHPAYRVATNDSSRSKNQGSNFVDSEHGERGADLTRTLVQSTEIQNMHHPTCPRRFEVSGGRNGGSMDSRTIHKKSRQLEKIQSQREEAYRRIAAEYPEYLQLAGVGQSPLKTTSKANTVPCTNPGRRAKGSPSYIADKMEGLRLGSTATSSDIISSFAVQYPNPDHISPREFYGEPPVRLDGLRHDPALFTAARKYRGLSTHRGNVLGQLKRGDPLTSEEGLYDFEPPFQSSNYLSESASNNFREEVWSPLITSQIPTQSIEPDVKRNSNLGRNHAHKTPETRECVAATLAPVRKESTRRIPGSLSESKTPAARTLVLRSETLAQSPTIPEADGWKVADLSRQSSPVPSGKTIIIEKAPKTSSNIVPSRKQAKKFEGWQLEVPSQSKETGLSTDIPCFPPPYPNSTTPAEGEVWIDDLGSAPLDIRDEQFVEGWEIVEETELYEQDERDWEAVKELDRNIANRDYIMD